MLWLEVQIMERCSTALGAYVKIAVVIRSKYKNVCLDHIMGVKCIYLWCFMLLKDGQCTLT